MTTKIEVDLPEVAREKFGVEKLDDLLLKIWKTDSLSAFQDLFREICGDKDIIAMISDGDDEGRRAIRMQIVDWLSDLQNVERFEKEVLLEKVED